MDNKIMAVFYFLLFGAPIMLMSASSFGDVPGAGKGAAYQAAEAMNVATPLSMGVEVREGLKALKKSKEFHQLHKGVRAAGRQLSKASTARAANKASKALAAARNAAKKPVSDALAKASREAFDNAKATGPVSTGGKLLGRAATAASLYQVAQDAKEGWDKGGAPEALKQGLGTMAGNQVNTEAMVFGAGLGAPAGPIGCLVGGVCGYVAVNLPIPGAGGSIKEGVEHLVKNNPATRALDEAVRIQAERDAWAALPEAERQKRNDEFNRKLREMKEQSTREHRARTEKEKIARQLQERGVSEAESIRQAEAIWKWNSEENKKSEEKRKAAEEAERKQAEAETGQKAPSNKEELIESLRKTGLSEDEARKQAEAMLKWASDDNRNREENTKAAAAAEKKKQEAGEGWETAESGYGSEKSKEAAWGDGGYEQISPADRYIDGIMRATESCDYQQALYLASRAVAEDPKNAWLSQNYNTIKLNAARLKNYNSAIDRTVKALESGNVDAGMEALGNAMQNVSTQCGQEKLVGSLLADAERIAKMQAELKREEAIEKAKWEAEKSAYARDRRRAQYERQQAERQRNAQDLQNSLMGIMGAVTRARSHAGTSGYGTTSGSGVDPYSDDIVQRQVRENERKYGDLMKKYQKSKNTSLSPPASPTRQAGTTSVTVDASWMNKPIVHPDTTTTNQSSGGASGPLGPATGGYECSGPKEWCDKGW